jgi:integrase
MQNYHAAGNPASNVPNLPFDQWADRWLWRVRLSVKPSSYTRYKNAVERHICPLLGRLDINQIQTRQLEAYAHEKLRAGRLDASGGLAPKTVSDQLSVIQSILKYAQSEGAQIDGLPQRIRIKKMRREARVFTDTEQRRLLQVLFDSMDLSKLGILLCLYTGLRIGELCALRWGSIHLEDACLQIVHTLQRIAQENGANKTCIAISEPKSPCARRMIPLPAFLVILLQSFSCSNPSAFFLTGTAGFIEPRTMQNRFKSYLNQGHIAEANFHALRHTFATRCIESGFDVKTLSEILGHASVKLTMDQYVHSSLPLKRAYMEKLTLPRFLD